ncbi:iron chelate uptake ABC transporter family permease subunit [Spiribacter vilamensis]|uniref:High-affinity zinc uptake system membrane protein ZnuB n=1 Tax=Spiribacter vilamensis TaxID=531306 RepID=A0A4Q8D2D9_9GAMM|nr:iron chelate uptake ABC transporter family permease subunit [Spiribacter vilamensis]RZU99549.1 zinc transport system permease protein [Spiribacter vilamensis]TVO61481.1 iron chelate uptake ABC transporter family permease subunit [Spiribacter vilamensis]
MLDDFMVRATLAGLGVVLAAAPLGCFVVWRRMAFFGAATAHAAVLGVALSLALSMSVFAGVLAVSLLMAVTVSLLTDRGYAMDTLLGVMAHSSLAFGLVAVSFLSDVRIDLMAYLFGDILAVGRTDLAIIWTGSLLVLGLTLWRWQSLLLATVSTEMAHAEGIDPSRERLILTVALAIVVAVAIKVVGVLLIAALLIIPAASARPFSHTPERMALIAAVVGTVSVLGGMWGSWNLDTPTGPSIVCVAAILFALLNTLARGLSRRHAGI